MKKKPIVSVNITSPETIFEDIRISLESSNFKEEIKKQFDTILKINTSWQHYYPACSTTPWQLEGVIKYLVSEKYKNILSEKLYIPIWPNPQPHFWISEIRRIKHGFSLHIKRAFFLKNQKYS